MIGAGFSAAHAGLGGGDFASSLSGAGYLTGPDGNLLDVPMPGEAGRSRGEFSAFARALAGAQSRPDSNTRSDSNIGNARPPQAQARAQPGRSGGGSRDDQLDARDAAEQFVAQAMVLPILKQMREFTMMPEGGPFAAGQHEKTFAPLVDQQLSEQIVRSEGFGVVDSVARMLRMQQGEAVRRADGALVVPANTLTQGTR